jgi:cation diffusion facilitator CzcD-associated flavoprotein CzcO
LREAREAIGGTWDLFRYPGIRSDSDMYTFGYSFYPWRAEQDYEIDRRTTLEGPIDDGILEFAKSGATDAVQVPALEEDLATT